MDFMGDFFGTNPSSPEERAAEMEDSLKRLEIEHVIRGGKVYIEIGEVVSTYKQIARLLKIRAFLQQDPISQGAASGFDVAASILDRISGEMLRREADAILKAED